jgi:hypothetical protein
MEVESRLRSPAIRTLAPNPAGAGLRPCEAKLLTRIHNEWALDFGTREIRLLIEYQDGVPVLIRVTDNTVREEKLR